MQLDLQLPLDSGWGYVSSEFGPRKSVQLPNGGWSSSFHRGIDFARAGGTPVYAPADGLVVLAGANGGLGQHVALRHSDSGKRLSSSVSHMQVGSITVKAGQWARKGQLIGRVGNTGNSGGNHLHFETYVDGEPVNPRNFYAQYQGGTPAMSSTQRQVGSVQANRRIGSPSVNAQMGDPLLPGTIGNFKGWVRGDSTSGNDVWFVGTSGDYFWSGGFIGGANVTGLTDLNSSQAMQPNQRRTITDLNGRAEPYTYSPVVQTLPVNTVGDFDGWKHGEAVSGETRWVRGAYSKNWFSLLYLEPKNVDGLTDLNTPVTEPKPDEKTEEDMTPKLVSPSNIDFPSWIQFDVDLDPDGQKPTLNLDAYKYYNNTPYAPIESHTHWWGNPGQSGTHQSNVNYIKSTKDLSVNFVTSAGRITMMVPLNKIALTTGQRNPFAWKSENDPALTELGYLTLGYLHYIVEKLNPSLKDEPIRLHKEFYSTTCSRIDVARVRKIANDFATGALDPATGKPPVVPPDPDPETVEISVDLFNLIKSLPSELDALSHDIENKLPKEGS